MPGLAHRGQSESRPEGQHVNQFVKAVAQTGAPIAREPHRLPRGGIKVSRHAIEREPRHRLVLPFGQERNAKFAEKRFGIVLEDRHRTVALSIDDCCQSPSDLTAPVLDVGMVGQPAPILDEQNGYSARKRVLDAVLLFRAVQVSRLPAPQALNVRGKCIKLRRR